MSALTDRARGVLTAVRWRANFATAIGQALLRRPALGDVEFIAITGSAGKTTTKDLCATMLSCRGPVTRSLYSANEAASVAETVAAARPGDRYAVLEVSGGEPGAMDWPLRLFKPHIAVVTLIQREHARSNFGLEEIAAEKFRLVEALPENGTAILNIDDPLLRERGLQCGGRKVIWVGRDKGATLRLLESESRWPQPLTLTVAYGEKHYTVATRLYGEHLALPVVCALAVGLATGMDLPEAIHNLQNAEPSEGRMQVVTGTDGVTFVRDDWKAPLWSLDAPLAFMRDATAPRKVMVIGTLSDYSRSASKLYPQVAEKALEIADRVIFVGPHAHRATKRAKGEQQGRLLGFSELREAALYLREFLRPGDLVLLKGTARVDHLAKVMLDRAYPVACWDSKCRKPQMCTRCADLYDFTIRGTVVLKAPVDTGDPIPLVACEESRFTLVGLGNPGEKYRQTRHNAGHLVLDALAREHGMSWRQTSSGQVAEGSLQDVQIMLVKPEAAINRSGDVIRRMLGPETLTRKAVVIHDDMDLELGSVKLRHGGGDGGHLGVRSIITACQSQDFQRIRLGVRPPGDDRKSLQLVHQHLPDQEIEQLTAAFSSGLQQLLNQAQREEVSGTQTQGRETA